MRYENGQVILNGKYRIEAFIGQGAFAEVYRATHLSLRSTRALKVLHREMPGIGSSDFRDFQQRFQLEAQIGAGPAHPRLIQVFDFEADGDQLILVMEYAGGGNLANRLREYRNASQPMSIEEVVQVARDVAEGLASLHGRDIIHRDLKPSNILFDSQGNAKVADLGLAQLSGGVSMRSRGDSRAPLHPGTPAYMSPEQQTTTAYLNPASDIYALGLVIYEMLTGRNYKNVKPGTPASALRADTPGWLDELLLRMTAQAPDRRPWDGAEVARELTEKDGETRNRERAAQAVQAKAEALRQEEDHRREEERIAREQAKARESEKAITNTDAVRQPTGAVSKWTWAAWIVLAYLVMLVAIAPIVPGNYHLLLAIPVLNSVQAVLLRRHIRGALLWVGAGFVSSIAGFLFLALLYSLLRDSAITSSNAYGFFFYALGSLITNGIGQWLILRRQLDHSQRWLIYSVLGAILAPLYPVMFAVGMKKLLSFD